MHEIPNQRLEAFPPVLDFEASSLSDCSYPISAGLVAKGQSYYWLIKPKSEWIDWSLASQAIHGLKRSYLIKHGIEVDVVYKELRSILNQFKSVYSDNVYWEARWLKMLGAFDIEIEDVRKLIPVEHLSQWKDIFQEQFQRHHLTAHRADHDAMAIALAAQQLRTQ